MAFKKGQSGNPSGRPKIAAEVKDLARVYTADAIKTYAQIMNNKKSPAASRVLAATELLNRGYGKATQIVEANVNLIDRLSHDDRHALEVALTALADSEDGPAAGTEATTH